MSNKNTPKKEWEYQYEREYNRIIQAINRQKKLGYFVPQEIIPVAPSKVKKITPEDVERLIELTPQKIRKSSIFIDKETGKSYPVLDVVKSHHTATPSEANIKKHTPKKVKTTSTGNTVNIKGIGGKPNKESDVAPQPSAPPKENNLNIQIIETVNNMLSEWQPAPYWRNTFLQRKTENYNKISVIWEETLDTDGEYETAHRLENNATELIRLLERLLYSSDSSVEDDFNMGRFIELLIGRPLTALESDEYSEIAREAALDNLRGENSLG